jgi:hypothetical protein
VNARTALATSSLAAALVARSAGAWACSACASVGEAPPILLATSPSQPAPLVASWDVRLSSNDAASHHGDGREQITEVRLSSSVRGWPSRWIGVEATHNAIARWFTVGQGTASALVSGDVDLLARAQLRTASGSHVVGVGLGARLGLAPELLDELGFARPVQLQVGSGAADFIAQLEYVCSVGAAMFSASARGRYAGVGRYQWQPGPSLTTSAAARYRFSDAVVAGASLDVRAAMIDTLDRSPVAGTGGLVLSTTPSIALRVSEGVWLAASATIALGQWWRGAAQDGLSGALSLQWTPMIPARPTRVRSRLLQADRDRSSPPRG